MPRKYIQQSFSGGEISTEMWGRSDLQKYPSGLSAARNVIILPHGPADRRPGFEFINEARDSTRKVRLVPFQFSATQSVVLEFGHQYIRFHSNGATVLETGLAITAISKANPGVLTYTGTDPSNGDWMFLSGIGGMTELNGRWVKVAGVNAGANTFQLTDLWDANINTTGFTTYTSGGTAARAYTVTTTYAEGDLFELTFAQSADVVTICHPSYAARELKRTSATSWTMSTVSFAPTLSAPTGVTATRGAHEAGTGGRPYTYCVTSVDDDGVTESYASSAATESAGNALGYETNYNTITWNAASGASRYYVYRQTGGAYGYIGQTTLLTVNDDNVRPDTTQAPPEAIITLNTGAGDYPAACAYHEQRRWFAGTTLEPQTIFATRTGTHSNLSSSIPARDADAMELTISSNQYNQIRHIVPFYDLIALTVAGEWRIFSDSAPAITPTSVSIKPQGYAGSSSAAPVVTPASVLFSQAVGGRVRELTYSGDNNSYQSEDLSILASHLFDRYTLVQMAYCRASESILWCVRGDGTLLGMTYVPSQQIFAWHRHDTDGEFESCAVVAEGGDDRLYVVVKRTVDGRDVRYIERLKLRRQTTSLSQDDARYLDSMLTYDSTPATVFSGLWHLEGEEVDILADGAVIPSQTVTNGAITLEDAASVVHVGLPYRTVVRTLPITDARMQAAGAGTAKNVNKIHFRLWRSGAIQAGPTLTRLREFPARLVEDEYDTAPSLMTEEISIGIDPSWNRDGTVYVVQDLPLPLTLLSMTLEAQTGG